MLSCLSRWHKKQNQLTSFGQLRNVNMAKITFLCIIKEQSIQVPVLATF